MDFVNLKKILQEIKDDRKCMIYLGVAVFYFVFSIIWISMNILFSGISWAILGVLYIYMFRRELIQRRKDIAEAI